MPRAKCGMALPARRPPRKPSRITCHMSILELGEQDGVDELLEELVVEWLAGHEQPGEQGRGGDLREPGVVGVRQQHRERVALVFDNRMPYYARQLIVVPHRTK